MLGFLAFTKAKSKLIKCLKCVTKYTAKNPREGSRPYFPKVLKRSRITTYPPTRCIQAVFTDQFQHVHLQAVYDLNSSACYRTY